jgi:hypothetical protein
VNVQRGGKLIGHEKSSLYTVCRKIRGRRKDESTCCVSASETISKNDIRTK